VKKLLALAGLLVLGGSLGVILASCGSEGASSSGPPPEQTCSTSASDLAKTGTSSPARLSGDGCYFGYIRAAEAKSQPSTISFDVAQTFGGGEAASRAAAEDGVIPPGESVPNDHYERNPDKGVRALEVAPDAWVPMGWPGGKKQGKLADFLAAFSDPQPKFLNDDYRGAHSQYWVTIRDGVVVRIDEQYFP